MKTLRTAGQVPQVRVVPAPQAEPAEVAQLSPAQIDHIEMRFRLAHGASDIGALAILAVEYFPALIVAAREGSDDEC